MDKGGKFTTKILQFIRKVIQATPPNITAKDVMAETIGESAERGGEDEAPPEGPATTRQDDYAALVSERFGKPKKREGVRVGLANIAKTIKKASMIHLPSLQTIEDFMIYMFDRGTPTSVEEEQDLKMSTDEVKANSSLMPTTALIEEKEEGVGPAVPSAATSSQDSRRLQDGGVLGGQGGKDEKMRADDSQRISLLFPCAPRSSIVTRLALELIRYQHPVTCAFLWTKFISHLRTLWESGVYVPNVRSGERAVNIDMSTCLLYQKLQMLNYCIYCKLGQREKDQMGDLAGTKKHSRSKGKKPSASGNDMMLLDGNPMVIPVVQDSGPMTQDEVQVH